MIVYKHTMVSVLNSSNFWLHLFFDLKKNKAKEKKSKTIRSTSGDGCFVGVYGTITEDMHKCTENHFNGQTLKWARIKDILFIMQKLTRKRERERERERIEMMMIVMIIRMSGDGLWMRVEKAAAADWGLHEWEWAYRRNRNSLVERLLIVEAWSPVFEDLDGPACPVGNGSITITPSSNINLSWPVGIIKMAHHNVHQTLPNIRH